IRRFDDFGGACGVPFGAPDQYAVSTGSYFSDGVGGLPARTHYLHRRELRGSDPGGPWGAGGRGGGGGYGARGRAASGEFVARGAGVRFCGGVAIDYPIADSPSADCGGGGHVHPGGREPDATSTRDGRLGDGAAGVADGVGNREFAVTGSDLDAVD